jgi:hypothetical protein
MNSCSCSHCLEFDRYDVHYITRTRFDENGFDILNKHKITGTFVDLYGFKVNGFHIVTRDIYDPKGFDQKGKHEITNTRFDPEGRNRRGFTRKEIKTFARRKPLLVAFHRAMLAEKAKFEEAETV